MDANNINTGVSQLNDEFSWFKPKGNVHVEGHMVSPPDFSIPPTPASSYSNLHVVLDTVHPSTETITRGVLPPHSHIQMPTGRPYAGPTSFTSAPSFTPATSSFTPAPSAPSIASRSVTFSDQPSSFYDNKLDSVPQSNFRAVPEAVNPELPGARSSDALTSLKSEIAPMPAAMPPMVPLEEFDDLVERTDRALPASVDLPLIDESQKWNSQWNKVGDDVRNKNWQLHHLAPERDAYWSSKFDLVGNDIKGKNWNLRRFRPLPSSFKIKPWAMIDQLEEAERKYRSSRGIDGLWSGRLNRVHHEMLNFVFPLGWAQWFFNLKNKAANKVANKTADLIEEASDIKNFAKNSAKQLVRSASDVAANAAHSAADVAANAVHSAANIAYSAADVAANAAHSAANAAHSAVDIAADVAYSAANVASNVAHSAADVAVADFELAKDLAGSAASKVVPMLGAAKNLARSASDVIADKVVDLTTTPIPPIPKYELPYSAVSELYVPFNNRKLYAEIIAMEEVERADRMSRGINPVVSGLWHRLGREMLHTYRDDLAELFYGLRLKLTRKGSDIVNSAVDAYNNFAMYKAPLSLAVPRGVGYQYAPVIFNFARRVPYEIIAMEEAERADRMSRGINPIISGLWYRIGQELKYKFALRPTLTSTVSLVADAAKGLAERAADKLIDLSEAVVDKSKDLLAPAPIVESYGSAPLNLFAYDAEPIDFTFKSRKVPAEIIAMEEKERADRIAEGVDAIAYSKWNALLSQPHKTLFDAPSVAAAVLPALSHAKDSLVESGKGITGFLGSWASAAIHGASSIVDAAKHTKLGEAAMEYVHPDPSSNYAEEVERTRRMNAKLDPVTAARKGRVQEELLHSIKSV